MSDKSEEKILITQNVPPLPCACWVLEHLSGIPIVLLQAALDLSLLLSFPLSYASSRGSVTAVVIPLVLCKQPWICHCSCLCKDVLWPHGPDYKDLGDKTYILSVFIRTSWKVIMTF